MSNQGSRDDELGWGDVFRGLARRRRVFWAVLALSLCAAFAYTMLRPPPVLGDMVVGIGQFDGKRLEDPKEVIAGLAATYGVNRRRGNPRLSGVEPELFTVELFAQGATGNEVVQLLDRVATGLIQRHHKIYDEQVVALTAQRDIARDQAARLRGIIAREPQQSQQSGELPFWTTIGRPNVVSLMIEAEQRVSDIDRRLADPNNRHSTILRAPEIEKPPILYWIIVLVAGTIIGLILGILVTFSLEIIDRARGVYSERPS